jgi:hypothetical protein
MEVQEPTRGELSDAEQERLDALLGAARRFHYWAFVLSGLSLLLSSLEGFTQIDVPIVQVTIPALQANVGIYMVVLALIFASAQTFEAANPWLKLDRRRPPFAWIALSSKRPSMGLVTFWLLVPVLLCAIATGASVPSKDWTGFLLSFCGVLFVFVARPIEDWLHLIHQRLDHRGGPATFSIWLLYWYRLLRMFGVAGFFLFTILAVIPRWRANLLLLAQWCVFATIVLYVGRLVAGAPPLYRRIDSIGRRFGFPTESKHYR